MTVMTQYLFQDYKRLTDNETVTCAHCGSALTRHAIAMLDTTTHEYGYLGVDCAGTLNCTPRTNRQVKAMDAKALKILLKAELTGAITYRDSRLATLGLTLDDLRADTRIVCMDAVLLPSEGGNAHNGRFVREVMDRYYPNVGH